MATSFDGMDILVGKQRAGMNDKLTYLLLIPGELLG